MKEPEPFETDTHRNRRDQKLFGEWPGEKLKSLIVARLIERADGRRYLFFNIAWQHHPALSAKHAGMVITELVAHREKKELASTPWA